MKAVNSVETRLKTPSNCAHSSDSRVEISAKNTSESQLTKGLINSQKAATASVAAPHRCRNASSRG